jgi:MacB-like protein
MHRFQFTRRLLEILHDARLSVRALLARPLFTLTTVMTFALGIGATAVVFSLVHSVLLSPLPYREPDRLAFVQQVIPEIADRVPVLGVNPRSFTSWEQACRTTCEKMAALVASTVTLTGLGEPEGLIGAKISPALFEVLGIPPMLGRSFTREEDAPGRNAVVIITHGFWQRRLAGDPAVIGRVLTLDGVPASSRRRSACPNCRNCPCRIESTIPSSSSGHSPGRTTCAAPGVSSTTQSSFDGRRESPIMRSRPSSPHSPGPITRGRRFTLTPSHGR